MAANRLRHLIPFLLEQGHRVHVICPRLGDESIPTHPHLHIHSLSSITNRTDFRSKLGRKALFPFLGAWIGWGVARAVDELYVVSSIPEVEAWVIGFGVKLLFPNKVRLTVEVRDPFSMNSLYPWGCLRKGFYHVLERRLLSRADQLIFLTTKIQELYRKTFPGSRIVQNHSVVITNGFDPATHHSVPRPDGNRIQITHVGTFYGDRNPLVFLSALEEVLKNGDMAKRLEVRFVGTVHGEDLSRAIRAKEDSLSSGTIIHWEGPVGHARALEAMQDSDINLLITHTTGSEYAIPGKLFEYLGAGKPILALTSDPLVVELLDRLNAGWVCSGAQDLISWFRTHLAHPEAVRSRTLDPALLKPYHWSNIHQRWAEFVTFQHNQYNPPTAR